MLGKIDRKLKLRMFFQREMTIWLAIMTIMVMVVEGESVNFFPFCDRFSCRL